MYLCRMRDNGLPCVGLSCDPRRNEGYSCMDFLFCFAVVAAPL